MFLRVAAFLAAQMIYAHAVSAQDSVLASIVLNGTEQTIRQATPDPAISAGFAVTRPDCAGDCIAPIRHSRGITTVGEAEVIAFLQDKVAAGAGLLIDSRTPERRQTGHIAGSVNVPQALIAADNPYLTDILQVLGARTSVAGVDFDAALPVIVFDDGPLGDDAAMFIANLLNTGYPSDRISYYRGGMLVWSALGLSFEGP